MLMVLCNPNLTFPAEVTGADVLPSCFSFHAVNKSPFQGLLSATFFTFSCLLWLISLFKVAPNCSAEVLPGVPKLRKAVIYLQRKWVCSDMSDSAWNSILMSQRYIPDEMFLNRNT